MSARESNAGPIDDENIPWAEYVPVNMAPHVSQQILELPCDGAPGILRVAIFSLKPKPGRCSSDNSISAAVLCCAGCYECMEGPSCLYNQLASHLPQTGVMVVQLAYRPPGDEEEEAAEDVMTCIDWLVEQKSLRSLVLVGWSMGAAAVIEAAYLRRNLGAITAVITLAAQTAGASRIKQLEVPILAVHGESDQVLPVACSKSIVQRAQQGTLLLLQHSSHRMEHAFPPVLDFIRSQFPKLCS